MTPHEKALGKAVLAYHTFRGTDVQCVREIVAAYLAAMREAGWQMVPKEADQAMHYALEDVLDLGNDDYPREWSQSAWSAMLAAAPDVLGGPDA